MSQRYEKTQKKGHGCAISVVALLLVGCAVAALLMFTTNLLDGTKNKIMSYFFPQEYSQYVTEYSAKYGVDEALIYAVIRTESGFRVEVESSAGAVGLMQLMPSTFEWLQSSKDGNVTLSKQDMKSPQINIEYGTYLLSILLDKYDDERVAVAAYNAGMTNVDEWLSNKTYSPDGKTLSQIPFGETSEYVERVQKTRSVYESLYYDKNK